MTSQNIKNFLRILGNNPEYSDLLNRANRLNKMKHILTASAVIPPHLQNHCELGQLSHGQLTLLAKNASVAAKLKHISPSLLQKIQKLGWKISAIKILVQKPDHPDHTETHQECSLNSQKTKISPAGIENLNRLASTLPDSELKDSIQQLVKKHS